LDVFRLKIFKEDEEEREEKELFVNVKRFPR